MRYRCLWKTVEIEVFGGQLHSEWECCFMRLKGASWRKRYLNTICIISNTQKNRCKRLIHHHEVDHRVRSVNREEAPKVGACVRSPYFSDVIATNQSSKNRSGRCLKNNGHRTWALPNDCVQLPSEKNEGKQPAFVNSKSEHETEGMEKEHAAIKAGDGNKRREQTWEWRSRDP
jgi:hypothetical protein